MNNPVYSTPALLTLSPQDLIEALGPVQTQYVPGKPTMHSAEGCLPLSNIGDTQQDTWTFNVPRAPARVKLFVDSIPGLPAGPLDPKMAVYEPGVTPAPGPFGGYNNPDCGGNCVIFDGLDCTNPSPPLADNACPFVEVTLDAPGNWTLAVAPETAAGGTGSQGCYRVDIEGPGLGGLVQTSDDGSVVFFN